MLAFKLAFHVLNYKHMFHNVDENPSPLSRELKNYYYYFCIDLMLVTNKAMYVYIVISEGIWLQSTH